MSLFHCSCGFAIDRAEELADHLHQSFASGDDIGTDGLTHHELASGDRARPACACGFVGGDIAELDDHLVIAFITPDAIGTDGKVHVLTDPSTPDHWQVRPATGE